jgi:xylose dehydrogenase (NAD/NADP)
MTEKIRWGILGTGRIVRAVIPAMQSGQSQLMAIASRSIEKAQRMASDWEIPTAYGSYEDLLADPNIDAVYNPLPNSLHKEWSIKAAEAGKHVLCEKPLALTPADVDELIAASKRTGKIITEAFMYRHHPQTLKVMDLVNSGSIGEVRSISGVFTIQLTRPGDNRWVPEYGGGSLWDLGCYPVSYAHLIAGQAPQQVFGYQFMTPSGVDHTFFGQALYYSGMVLQFKSGFWEPYRTGIEIQGSEGSLVIPNPFSPKENAQIILKNAKNEEIFSFEDGDVYRYEVENLANAILTGESPRISLEESRQISATLCAFYRSAQIGEPVCHITENKS